MATKPLCGKNKGKTFTQTPDYIVFIMSGNTNRDNNINVYGGTQLESAAKTMKFVL